MRKKLLMALSALLAVVLLYGEMSLFAWYHDSSRLPGLHAETEMEVPEESEPSYVNAMDWQSNRYTHLFEQRDPGRSLSTEGYAFLLGNERIGIYLREEDYDVRVVDLANGYVWGSVDRDSVKDMNKRWKTTAASLMTVNYLDAKFSEKTLYMADAKAKRSHVLEGDTVVFTTEWEDIGLSVQLHLTLQADGFTLSVPDEGIVENPKLPITSITLMPFFGTARLEEKEGYFFLPDGSGALMRFQQGRDYISTYSKRIYGSDLGIEKDYEMTQLSDVNTRPDTFSMKQPRVMMPVYGNVHGVRQSAYWVEVTGGTPYARICADAATTRLNYHYIRTQYEYRACYVQPTSSSGTGVRTVSKERNEVQAEQKYHFLHGEQADYVGMAKAWRDLLLERSTLSDSEEKNAAPLTLEVMAGVRTKGYLSNTTMQTASADAVKAITDELHEAGTENVRIALLGWMKGGVGGYRLDRVVPEKQFADTEKLQELQADMTGKGYQMLLAFDAVRMTEDQMRTPAEAATSISQQQVMERIENEALLFPNTYYRRNALVREQAQEIGGFFAEHGFEAAGAGLGEMLYSDHLMHSETLREEAMRMQTELAEQLASSVTTWYTPSCYLWQHVKQAMYMPDHASQYQYITDTVPFMQIVLHGSMDCFSAPLNQDNFSRASILRMMEYGQYPTFLITTEEGNRLTESAMYDAYSTQYSTWKKEIQAVWQEVNDVLRHVTNARIDQHTVLAEGLVAVAYDNGVTVYVNYTLDEQTADGVAVPAQTAVAHKRP